MALLGELGLLERLALTFEIGARILLVGVEEEAVEPAVVVVVPLDVGLGALAVVAPLEPIELGARLFEQLHPARLAEDDQILGGERDEVVEVACDELEAAVHVELAERQFGVQQEFALRGAIGEADGDLRPRAVAKSTLCAVAGLDLEIALTHQLVYEQRKKPVHCAPLGPANLAAEGHARPPIETEVYTRARREFNIDVIPPPFRRIVQTPRIDKVGRGAYFSGRSVPRRGKGRQAVRFRAFVVAAASFARRLHARGESPAPRGDAAARDGAASARSERSKMLDTVLKRMFGSANDRRLKGYRPKIAEINALEPEFAALTDEQLRAKTDAFRAELAAGKTVDDLLAPAFAVVREAAKRTLKQRHFDVQLIGGMVLHEGSIAEMRTGEGKTLVATLAVYLNALAGKGVHVVTVNDYLARRDSEWMGQIYTFLGMSVGVIVNGLDDEQRRQAYAADITYGTNNEFGFDYLRDNMKYDMSQMVQRGHAYAIVDEVDSILVDEARTPLIISGPSEDRSGLYVSVDALIPSLVREDYDIDEKQRTVSLTETGNEHVEALLRGAGVMKEGFLYEAANATLVHHVNQALRAHKLFQLDKDYIVRNGEVVIVDEFTGRMMPGRRYSEGLHQALEAKEHVAVQPENVTLASITFQNYFRLYKKLAGMTGTAATEADEFAEIYKLVVVEIPTHRPVDRLDEDDEVYRTNEEKLRAVVREIEEANAKMQPMLVGTTSIEKSEQLAEVLERRGYKKIDFTGPNAMTALYAAARVGKPSKNFAVLNARHHEQEAFIVAEAGVPGAITIATNMAGRGTDIQLGGNVEMRVKQELDPAASQEERDAKEARSPRRGRGLQAEGDRGRRPLHHGHRAAREPPHRQPAARPLGPPGRPRPLEVLPVAARRPDAHLRLRAHGRDAEAARA